MWVLERPTSIQEMIKNHNLRPDIFYRLKTTDQKVIIISLFEDQTVMVGVYQQFNKHMLNNEDMEVFGVDPGDLEECDCQNPQVSDEKRKKPS